MKKTTVGVTTLILLASLAMWGAEKKPSGEFSEASLDGSYSAQEAGDGSVAVGLGVVEYDGEGNATRKITVNAPDGSGGRHLLVFESEGTYTVNPDGTGTVVFTNASPNPGAVDTFDFVITGSAPRWLPGQRRSLLATELFAAQREAGVTVSLVTSVQKRVAD